MTEDTTTPALAKARALLIANRPEDALRDLATLPASDALGAYAALLRCAALLELGRWQETVDAAQAGLATSGPNPDLLCVLGRAEQQLNHLEAAERALLAGLALAPTDLDLLCAYAQLCIAAGQVDKAAKLTERATAQQPEAPLVYATRIHLAYAQGDARTAERISREFVGRYPESPTAHALQGRMSALQGRVRPAYAGLAQAAAATPSNMDYADAAMELRVYRHPLLYPLRPLVRLGPLKSWVLAAALVFGTQAIGLLLLSNVLGLIWITVCVYSWVVPPLVRRSLRRRWR